MHALVAAHPQAMRVDTLRAELSGRVACRAARTDQSSKRSPRRPSRLRSYAAELDVVTVDLTGGSTPAAEQLRVWLNFGEHGRELVSTEAAIATLRLLALGPDGAAAVAGGGSEEAAALKRTIFKVVPLENAAGRAKVEAGELCLRTNGRGVDPNRNWATHWGFKEKDYDPYEEAAGAHPFSEPEAALLRDAVAAWRPHAWVNIHSGMRAMFMPFDHIAAKAGGAAGAAHEAVLAALKARHCGDCETGSGGATVGYLAHGTATDYVFSNLSVPIAMTWEIYGDTAADRADCFRMFNPLGRDELRSVVDAWAAACATLPSLLHHHADVPRSGGGGGGGGGEGHASSQPRKAGGLGLRGAAGASEAAPAAVRRAVLMCALAALALGAWGVARRVARRRGAAAAGAPRPRPPP